MPKTEKEMFLARLVGDFVAACETKKLSDIERRARPAFAKAVYLQLNSLGHAQISRVYRGLCSVEYKEPDLEALTGVVLRRLGNIYRLAEVRGVVIPTFTRPTAPAKK